VWLKYGDILSFFPEVLDPFCFSLTLRDSSKVAPMLEYLRFMTCSIDYDIVFMYFKIEQTVGTETKTGDLAVSTLPKQFSMASTR
jgi:hypothetical protein